MIRHLTRADYRRQPWANGRGETLELLRVEGPEGLHLRLSVAAVTEDGPFSLFPGIERNLTVLSGPGFRLTGAVALTCAPLAPVAFPGDLPVAAEGVTAPCTDFNVMTARALPRPEVRLATGLLHPGPKAVLDLASLALTLTDEGLALHAPALVVTGALPFLTP